MKIKQFPRLSAAFWAAAAPFLFFIFPLLRGKAIFWGLPSLQFIPWRHYAWSLMREGILPLWNSLNGMGAPLLANYQLALFYPPAFPLILLDEIWGTAGLAWGLTLLVPVHLAWGAAGMTRFLRQLGVGYRGQLIAGLAFGMSGYLVARGSFFSIIWVAAWLPWVMCWIDKVAAASEGRGRLCESLVLSLLMAMLLLAGHAQIAWYSLLLAGLWYLFRIIQTREPRLVIKKVGILAVIGVGAVLMAAIQLIPTFEYLQQSQRASAYDIETAMVYSFSPLRLLGYLTPELFGNPGLGDFWGYAAYWEDAIYIGLAPFILALTTIGWVLLKKHRGNSYRGVASFLWSITLVGVIMALGANTPVFPWLYRHVPSFDMFQAPARWMIWPTFSLAVLAGLAADSWAAPSMKKKVILNLVAFGGIILAISAGAASLVLASWEPGLFRGLIFFGLTAAVTAFVTRRIPAEPSSGKWGILAVMLIVIDLFAASALLNPTAPADIWSAENGQLTEINQTRDGSRVWVNPTTEQKVKFDWFFKFDDFMNRSEWYGLRSSQLPNINLLDEIPYVNNFDPLLPARYASWRDELAGQTPLIQHQWLSRAGAGAEIIPDPAELRQTTVIPIPSEPRFVWFPCASMVDSPEEALDLVRRQVQAGEVSNCLVVEGDNPQASVDGPIGEGEVKLRLDSPNRIALEVNSTHPGWVLIRDSWFPGWQVKVDDQDSVLYPADYLFRAVFVPDGNHHIELEYRPASFVGGGSVSLLSWVLWGTAWIICRNKRPSEIKSNG